MKTLFTLTALFITTTLFSQKVFLKDSTAACMANWKKGDRKILYIAHNKENVENGKVASQSSFGYEAHVKVMDKDPQGYTIQWVFQLPEAFKQLNPSIADSLPVFNGMKMLYRTDESGGFLELLNWEEVRDTYVKMMELSIPPKKDGVVDGALEKAKAMFNSKQMVEAALIREIQLYHAPYGNSFSTRGVKLNTQIPTPLTDQPLPAVQTSQISELKPKQDVFTLVITHVIDKAGATNLFEDIFKKMGLEDDKTLAEAKKLLENFTIAEYSEYHIKPAAGWVTKINYRKTGKTEDMGQTDSFIIEMKTE